MHRQPLLDLLTDYATHHPADAEAVDRVRTLVEAHPDCFDRTCRPGHITGSAWVVSSDGRQHLLLHHRKLDKWLQPGGHADGDPDVARVALREAAEESGLDGLEVVTGSPLVLDVDVHEIPARYNASGDLIEDAHEHHDIRFLVRAAGACELRQNEESNALRWCTTDEIRQLTNEISVLRLMERATIRLGAGESGCLSQPASE